MTSEAQGQLLQDNSLVDSATDPAGVVEHDTARYPGDARLQALRDTLGDLSAGQL